MLGQRGQRGFLMIDALVTLAIATVGIAGTCLALQQGLRTAREARTEAEALRLLRTAADELRALRRPDGRALLAVTGADPGLSCAAAPTSCPAEQQAAAALLRWQATLQLGLPLGSRLVVTVPDPALTEYQLVLHWPAALRELQWWISA